MAVREFKQIRPVDYAPSIAALSSAGKQVTAGFGALRTALDERIAAQEAKTVNEATQKGLSMGLTSRQGVQNYLTTLKPDIAKNVGAALYQDVKEDRSEVDDILKRKWDEYSRGRTKADHAKTDATETAFGGAIADSFKTGTDVLTAAQNRAKDLDPTIAAGVLKQAKEYKNMQERLSDTDKAMLGYEAKKEEFAIQLAQDTSDKKVATLQAKYADAPKVFDEALIKKLEGSTNISGTIQEIFGAEIEDPIYAGIVNALVAPPGVKTGTAGLDHLKSVQKDLLDSGKFTENEAAAIVFQAYKNYPNKHDLLLGRGVDTKALEQGISEIGIALTAQKQLKTAIATEMAKGKIGVLQAKETANNRQMDMLNRLSGRKPKKTENRNADTLAKATSKASTPTPANEAATAFLAELPEQIVSDEGGPSFGIPSKRAPGFAASQARMADDTLYRGQDIISRLQRTTRKGKLNIPKKSRLASVNNNPGNMKQFKGSGLPTGEKGFIKYPTPEAGFKAVVKQIGLYATRDKLTLSEAISKYAPASENETNKYIQYMVKELDVPADTKLSDLDPTEVAKAIVWMESNSRFNS